MATKQAKNIRVGLLVAGSLMVLMTFLFFIGSEQKIFARKNEYNVQLENVSGLAEGNPVRMSGVTIGVIHDIVLIRDGKRIDELTRDAKASTMTLPKRSCRFSKRTPSRPAETRCLTRR